MIQQAVDDMLVEAAPRRFADPEVSPLEPETLGGSPVRLVNQAWREFHKNPRSYGTWESNVIYAWLTTDLT